MKQIFAVVQYLLFLSATINLNSYSYHVDVGDVGSWLNLGAWGRRKSEKSEQNSQKVK